MNKIINHKKILIVIKPVKGEGKNTQPHPLIYSQQIVQV